ncbi:MAG: hypothetical protein JWN96_793 [Mycobacterium sp.]|jgi:uncharacterized protein YoxC|nr:hypothetical protein [Mycobacterium sp.]
MSAGAVAGLIAAGAFLIIALFTCYALAKLARIFDEVGDRVRQTDRTIDESTDRIRQAGTTVDEVNTALASVNVELARVEQITTHVENITGNISALTSVFASTLGGPVIKVAAFSYGVRRAASKRTTADIESRVKAEVKAEKVATKAARKGKGLPAGDRS